MSRPARCAAHPWHAARTCVVCIADHKAGEHRAYPSPDCPSCQLELRLADARHTQTVDAQRRASADR